MPFENLCYSYINKPGDIGLSDALSNIVANTNEDFVIKMIYCVSNKCIDGKSQEIINMCFKSMPVDKNSADPSKNMFFLRIATDDINNLESGEINESEIGDLWMFMYNNMNASKCMSTIDAALNAKVMNPTVLAKLVGAIVISETDDAGNHKNLIRMMSDSIYKRFKYNCMELEDFLNQLKVRNKEAHAVVFECLAQKDMLMLKMILSSNDIINQIELMHIVSIINRMGVKNGEAAKGVMTMDIDKLKIILEKRAGTEKYKIIGMLLPYIITSDAVLKDLLASILEEEGNDDLSEE
ncbi:hypothetical protein HK407_02g03740 [Ordospora pajunii]|uniref:uncharacterized protein n=1 Tax=Ordospora pajunii TaxID=3039483 RepID=UPI0029527E3A|nr:uncharacterized protein HK407_02g03740 [Ordospora pajunii]KAH9411929.1 hypothetical protein HK407_02g03740 [Ordospora pajunii]